MLSEKQTIVLELILTFKHIDTLSVSIIICFLNKTKYEICSVPCVLILENKQTKENQQKKWG